MTTLLFAVKWVHLTACVALTGALFMLLLVGRPTTQAVFAWERRVFSLVRWTTAVALVSGLGWLAVGAMLFEGRVGAALEPLTIWRSMVGTWSGHVWMVRLGLLLVLAAFLLVHVDVTGRWNWLAARLEAFLLAFLVLVLLSPSGHAAAISGRAWPLAADMLHLLGAGTWVGGLAPLSLLLYLGSRNAPMPDPVAVQTMQRFSSIALVSVLLLGGTGSALAILLVRDAAGLVGTAHGQQLLAKLLMLLPALLLAAVNRSLLPGLSGQAAMTRSAIAQRMALFIALETVVVVLVVGLAAAMTVNTPARHGDAVWPWSVRLSLDTSEGSSIEQSPLPDWRWQWMIVLVSIVALAVLLRRRRFVALISALCLLGIAGSTIDLPVTTMEAFPTSYMRPRVTYHAGSVAQGAALYRAHCASCHGTFAATQAIGETGDEIRAVMSEDAGDLRARATARRTAGELFWLVSYGRPHTGMPAFSDQLADAQRWHLINYLRAEIAADRARTIGPDVEPERGWLVAPDFTITVGPLTPGLLRDFRGQRLVLLVFYDLPGSSARMAELARSYRALSVLGVEVVAVSPRTAPEAIAALGASSPILFPVVTAGNEEIVAAYRLFTSSANHSELLIDRQGYIRAIWRSDQTGMPDAIAVQAQVVRLNEEQAPPSLPSDHVH